LSYEKHNYFNIPGSNIAGGPSRETLFALRKNVRVPCLKAAAESKANMPIGKFQAAMSASVD
jgi:hypothetical protein